MTKIIHPKCKACNLPIDDRKALDRSLLRGEPITTLSQQYNLSRDVLYRHKKGHLPAAAARGVQQTELNHGVRLLEDLDDMVSTARRILSKAEADGHSKTALLALKESRASIMAVAQLSHAIWLQQHEDKQTIVVEQQSEQEKQWLREGLAALSDQEYRVFRQLLLKMFAAAGSRDGAESPHRELSPDDEQLLGNFPLAKTMRGMFGTEGGPADKSPSGPTSKEPEEVEQVPDPAELPNEPEYVVDPEDSSLRVRPIPARNVFDPKTGALKTSRNANMRRRSLQ